VSGINSGDLSKTFQRDFTPNGRVYCKVCGRPFHSVCAHAWQAHGLSAKQYKRKFGLCLSHAQMSDGVIAKFRENAFKRKFNELNFRVKYVRGHLGASYISAEARAMSSLSLQERQLWRKDPIKHSQWRANLKKAWAKGKAQRVEAMRKRLVDPASRACLRVAAKARRRGKDGKFS
jgi:ribosomal protein L34E